MISTTNHSDNARYSNRNMTVPVNFLYAAPQAKQVELVGDFNHWHPFAMERMVDGWWHAQILLHQGHHRYRFLVDGKPTLDPHASGITRDDLNERASLLAVS